MAVEIKKFERSVHACIENGKRLIEDAEWSANRASTGMALAMLAQEECAKAFVLALVRDGILPWTQELKRSLSVHECKNLVMIIMEWLSAVNELRLNEMLNQTPSCQGADSPLRHLPADVATAMNIYRHEMIERIGRRYPERFSDWSGKARRVAEGQRDRKKQGALYVGVGEDGDVISLPPTSDQAFTEEFARAKALIEFAEDVDRECIFAYREYELFAEVFRVMFKDLAPESDDKSPEEELPSGIPGVVFVRKSITVADVVPQNRDEQVDSGTDAMKG